MKLNINVNDWTTYPPKWDSTVARPSFVIFQPKMRGKQKYTI